MRILKRPMFKKGGSANEGIMDGLVDRRGYAEGDAASKFASLIDPDEALLDYWGTGPKEPEGVEQPVYIEPGGELKKGYRPLDVLTKVPEAIRGYDVPITPSLPKKKAEVTIGGAEGYDVNSYEDRKSRMSRREKEFFDILSPGAKKRAITSALASASGAFGESTGDTKQDIARAITAAAEATGGMQDIAMTAKKLAIEEDIRFSELKETAKFKALYKDYAPSEKIKSVNALVSKGRDESDAIDTVFGVNNIYTNVAEASEKEVGVPESAINIAAGKTYKEDYKGPIASDDWEAFKIGADDGVYKVGKKIIRVETVEGKKKYTTLADFGTQKT